VKMFDAGKIRISRQTLRTDRQTDGQTDRIAISISRVSSKKITIIIIIFSLIPSGIYLQRVKK